MRNWSTSKKVAATVGVAVPTVVAAAPGAVTAAGPVPTHEATVGAVHPSAVVTNLCAPNFGSGKFVGVPIVVEDGHGGLVTDITGLTFELSNGTDTQDVTAAIGTNATQPIVVGDPTGAPSYPSITARYGFGPATGSDQTISLINSATPPTLAWAHPGYFFLGCTPNPGDPTVTFPAGTELIALRNGLPVAHGSVTGRSAVGFFTLGSTIRDALKPTTPLAVSDLPQVYKDLVAKNGIWFGSAVAQLVMSVVSQNYDSTNVPNKYCFNQGLITVNSGAWTWSTQGSAWLTELTSHTETAYSTYYARTNGTVDATCTAVSSAQIDYLLDAYGLQMLLFDGPEGKAPSAAVASAHWLGAAQRLVPYNLPPTGVDAGPLLVLGGALLGTGVLLVGVRSRRRRAVAC